MQAEGLERYSNGRLTTSLIAPVAIIPPPKSPVDLKAKLLDLGSQQRGNGKVRYRIGAGINVDDVESLENLRDLQALVGRPLANGQITIHPVNEHLHLYLRFSGSNEHLLHLIVEDQQRGLIAGELLDSATGERVSGLVVDPLSPFENNGSVKTGLPSKSFNNTIVLKTSEPTPLEIELGKLVEIVVDCGAIDKTNDGFRVERNENGVQIFSKDPDLGSDPFGRSAIASLTRNDIASKFAQIMSVQLKPEIAAGFVPPVSQVYSSARGI